MRKDLVLLLVFILSYGNVIIAQQITPAKTTLGRIVSASPEASSIAMYQSYPVDYVSGAPDIEIPLFNVPTKAGTIPFKLSYHIGKLRPSELATGPGWGWTLTPNLGITRSVKGNPDGATSGYPANTLFGQTSDDYYYSIATGIQDEEPDNFFYSLLSKGGQFVYNRKGGFTQITADAVKIVRVDDNSFVITDDDGTIYKFGKYSTGTNAMTEASGTTAFTSTATWKITEIIPYDKSDTVRFIYGSPTTYIMGYYNIQTQVYETLDSYDPVGGMDKPVNIYHNVYNSGQGTVLTGAQVMRPTSVRKGSISSYTPFDVTLPAISDDDYKIALVYGTGSTREQAAWANLDYGTDHVADVMSDALTDEMPLTEIRFKGGRVGLVYTNSNKQLLSVSLYATGNSETLIRKAYLYQHALHHANNEQPFPYYEGLNTRYGLDSVRISGTDNAAGMTYKMTYALKNTNEECVGVYGNFNTDFWGYPNGNNVFIMPHLFYQVGHFVWNSLLENTDYANLNGAPKNGGGWVEFGSTQESNASSTHYMVPGIIKRLYYPTGGYAEFDFENNQYQSSNDLTRVVYGGGFRVKQIKYTTGDQRDSIIKVYKYGTNEDGVGRTKYKNYSQNFISVQYINTTKYGLSGNHLQKVATINSKPFLEMSFASGAAVLYQQVAEYTVNPVNNQTLGKTVYNYTIDSRNDSWIANTPLQVDPRTDWKIISNTSVANYRYNNGNYDILNKTENTFTDFYTDTVPASQTFLKYYNANPGSTLSSDVLYGQPTNITSKFEHITYSIYGGSHKLSSVKETLYNADDPSQYISTTTTINYDPVHLYRSSESKTDSKGLLRKMEALYAHQGSQITDLIPGQQTSLSALITANRISQPVETKEYNNGTLLQTIQQNFMLFSGKVYPSAVYAAIMSNPLEKKIETTLYDSISGNLLEQQKANDVKEVYVWGYNSQYPVAKILNSTYAIVKGFINQTILDNAKNYTDDQIRTELAKIRTGLAGTPALVLTYTYKPLTGMTSETDPTGKTIYYEYDSFGRVSLIKDQNGNIIKMYEYKVGY
ncbi:YD repeat-containing protein [Chitinophaga sp. YR573]|uniref:hypothetical protein n=1 Tax=Chitinophaga sp. YR573 TaxID=1881040 RepID=UPI0008D143B3|nr:hypothetical protein [Chitinophaga sp. YR573]SEV93860.1 YD repeat-containing protein [Chitinophaga sp. YR573]